MGLFLRHTLLAFVLINNLFLFYALAEDGNQVSKEDCDSANGTFYPGGETGAPSCAVIYSGGSTEIISSEDTLLGYIATNNKSNNPATATGTTCATVVQQIQDCVESADEAVSSSCNPQANSQMNSVLGMAKTLTNQVSAINAASIEAACSQMGELATKANEALLAFEGYCKIAESDCSSTCEQADAMKKSYQAQCQTQGVNLDTAGLSKAKRNCQKASSSLADAGTQIQNIMAQKTNAKQCESLTSNSMDAYCKANPTNLLCVNSTANVNCSDAAVASSNTVCICSANPRDPRCSQAGIAAASLNSTGTSGSGSSSSASSKLAGGNPSFGLGGGADGGDGFGAGLTGTAPGGAGGGGPGGRGASRNINGAGGEAPHTAGAKGQAGGGGNGFNTKINGGYYGGSGGGGGFGGGSGSSGSGAGGYNRGGYAGGPGGAGYGAQAKVDLRQFLPGGKLDPSRGLAGVAGPDGITGPNSDIWQKVNNRYQAVSNSLKH